MLDTANNLSNDTVLINSSHAETNELLVESKSIQPTNSTDLIITETEDITQTKI
jgi:hypothetical protein